ncbi:chemotaxis protein MotC [Mesorhizobium sp. M4B.F.Ca.ET.215.01.1.1]|uniref:chemotaxis protein MotC n=3 Tax=Mesorhizobium TaxID=68287 RepID=UPI000FCCCFF2|nr:MULTISPECIES: chemotaxis protein MotC [unclassified Mesorhizobium]RUW25046.1 chemotaxis protein MotC [Mesorhizobium sp. M4B.F.Ca.ET.013.02.1.1]RVD36912.1 chemotaxis protein MotC [Mesorhizobium sp. M4B.F.Ca.ET.019.03.1.1]TGQ14036.1 chemotaxis protein MotC [Mesorhizobium sp. M4B.F.Ca.ET.215.01.1.1]TGQ41563.1 chemotaxis protein MotC [Mesorhizobium sp. M4B.F.Ca.ET.214.01.1.1]TGQ47233.1 chemotaxis protein MotC [Mesorhizobium sp. M00.F.Ca.ET.220.01.1.1]
MKAATVIGRAVGLLLSAAAPSASFADEALQPYQLVRSLQLVQDRIAAGDHAALPMQAKLLEMTDARLRAADAGDFKEPRNFRALLVYGMSGGNPVTVEAAASRAETDPRSLAVAKGIISYLNGRPAEAIETLRPIDPMALPADLGAFLALVKGSLLATDQPAAALALLDDARLLSPGTLVEEAALRRSVGIAAQQGDAARFALASTQYVSNYLHSPYASQFADSFVSGVISLHMAISHDKLADITSMMDPEREKVIYLRIARRAAIDGLTELSSFASARAEQGRDGNGNEDDPRAQLYSSLSTVTSSTIEDVRAKLEKIDRAKLSESDRALLDAAQAVAGEVVARPAVPAVEKHDADAEKSAAGKPAAEIAAAERQEDADLPPVEGAMSEQPAVETSGPVAKPAERQALASPSPDAPASIPAVAAPTAQAPAPTDAPAVASASAEAAAVQPASTPEPSPGPDPSDATDAAMMQTRRQLNKIDQLLGAAPK